MISIVQVKTPRFIIISESEITKKMFMKTTFRSLSFTNIKETESYKRTYSR